MNFHKGQLVAYQENELLYPQKFAEYGFHSQRLNEEAYKLITSNKGFNIL